MDDYIYHITTKSNLSQFQGYFFRARRWRIGDYPHQTIRNIFSRLQPTEAVFQFAAYTTLEKSKAALQVEFRHRACYILRCGRTNILRRGFRISPDQRYEDGSACLFWLIEQDVDGKSVFSHSGIPIEDFDILINDGWKPLTEILLPYNDEEEEQGLTEDELELRDLDNDLPRPWWRFWR
jgi:hypothetical protein